MKYNIKVLCVNVYERMLFWNCNVLMICFYILVVSELGGSTNINVYIYLNKFKIYIHIVRVSCFPNLEYPFILLLLVVKSFDVDTSILQLDVLIT